MKIIYFLQNHSINLPEIWSDCSIYVFTLLLILMFVVFVASCSYQESIRIEEQEEAETKVLAISHELDNLNLQNCYLKEQYLAKQKEVDSLNEQLKRKRNPDGTFATTPGKGHGKKKQLPSTEIDWTKASKKELLAEAKRRYPVGTEFRVVHYPKIICTIKSHDKYENTFSKDEEHINLLIDEIDNKFECLGASVYAHGEWAKIIKS